jgi:hypothetical protein
MSRYKIEEMELADDDQIPEGGKRRFGKGGIDQPKRSPIRRKDRLRQEMGMKPKAKRNYKKLQNRIKYDWQGV